MTTPSKAYTRNIYKTPSIQVENKNKNKKQKQNSNNEIMIRIFSHGLSLFTPIDTNTEQQKMGGEDPSCSIQCDDFYRYTFKPLIKVDKFTSASLCNVYTSSSSQDEIFGVIIRELVKKMMISPELIMTRLSTFAKLILVILYLRKKSCDVQPVPTNPNCDEILSSVVRLNDESYFILLDSWFNDIIYTIQGQSLKGESFIKYINLGQLPGNCSNRITQSDPLNELEQQNKSFSIVQNPDSFTTLDIELISSCTLYTLNSQITLEAGYSLFRFIYELKRDHSFFFESIMKDYNDSIPEGPEFTHESTWNNFDEYTCRVNTFSENKKLKVTNKIQSITFRALLYILHRLKITHAIVADYSCGSPCFDEVADNNPKYTGCPTQEEPNEEKINEEESTQNEIQEESELAKKMKLGKRKERWGGNKSRKHKSRKHKSRKHKSRKHKSRKN